MQTQVEVDRLYSVEAAAEQLGGLSRWTIYSWVSSGKLEKVKIGSRTMIPASAIARIIEEGKVR
ncbi:MAG TPA: helix-turn-helix domain-containing protein [Candidatus Nanoarchaeia archaeon]|nr:helix-turn-helix domain-containing protein [Candidatus Nanoarchaeia archaeon]